VDKYCLLSQACPEGRGVEGAHGCMCSLTCRILNKSAQMNFISCQAAAYLRVGDIVN